MLYMRRSKDRKTFRELARNNSHAHFTNPHPHPRTIAEINQVSSRMETQIYHPLKPFRILLPQYFNIPKFVDQSVLGQPTQPLQNQLLAKVRVGIQIKKKLKDLEVLAVGMKRCKNIKDESRFYFTQGVLLHNSGVHEKSVAAFQKFLKIVLFIRDDKSIELALNSIGIEHILAGNYSKAIEYHTKQGEISQGADLFISHVNRGLCYQLQHDHSSALGQYQEAQHHCSNQLSRNRQKALRQMIQRVQKLSSQLFMTENLNVEKSQKGFLPKIMREKENSPQMRQHSPKVSKAIKHADQTMGQFLESMRNSFIAETL